MKNLPRGIIFFSRSAPKSYRRRRIFFAFLTGIAGIALVWPVYAVFGKASPLLLGIPPSLAWHILWLVIVMGALLWLYRSE